MMKIVLLAVLAALILAAMIPVSVTIIERRQAAANQLIEPFNLAAPVGENRNIVIYYSRSGNTGVAARHIATRLKSSVVSLEAPAYELGLAGWASAMREARSGNAEISPREIDLSSYDTVYLGSPIWLYSPAPPIWAFVRNNRFDGKRVVLFNTFNSEFGADQIQVFQRLVLERGATSFDHWHVRRGRMTRQLSTAEMLAVIDNEWLADEKSRTRH